MNELITHQDPKSPVAEAFRTIRTNLQFSSLDSEIRTIAITSAGPGEGKSTVLANLAVALAQSDKKVILVDSDLRRPTVHKKFGIENTTGLTNLLINGLTEDVLRDVGVPNLKVVTCGPLPPNPSELLGSKMMDKVIEFLKGHADMVLFDCPPVVAVTDAALLGRKLDGVIMTVRLGVVQQDALKRAKTLLENVQARVLGMVLNGVNAANGGYGYYYYYYYDSHDEGEVAG